MMELFTYIVCISPGGAGEIENLCQAVIMCFLPYHRLGFNSGIWGKFYFSRLICVFSFHVSHFKAPSEFQIDFPADVVEVMSTSVTVFSVIFS